MSLSIVISLSLFYTHTLNEIRYQLKGFSTEYFNVGATQRVGIEFSARQDLFSILNLQESFSYLYSNVLKGKMKGQGGSSGMLEENKPIPYVPLMKITLNADVEAFSMGKHSLHVWSNNSYYGNSVDNNQIDMNKNGYFLNDLGITYTYGDFNLSCGVRNVFDSFYIVYQNTGLDKDSRKFTEGSYLVGEGRNYFLEGRYSF